MTTMKELPYTPKAIIGRREMVELTDMQLVLCAKADTGARTSALHAEDITTFEEEGEPWVSFTIPGSGPDSPPHVFRMPLHDRRKVRSSNGQQEWRYVVRTPMRLGTLEYPVEFTLTDRRDMRHPMLLGRRALRRLLVAPGASFLLGDP